jgi:hypothetical protein
MDASKTGDVAYYCEVVQNFLELDGALPHSQHKQFWANLLNSQNTTTYLIVLLTKLLAIDSGDKTGLQELVRQLIQNGEPTIIDLKSNTLSDYCILTLFTSDNFFFFFLNFFF